MEIRTTLDELDSILTINEEKISELECCRDNMMEHKKRVSRVRNISIESESLIYTGILG